MEHQPTTVEQVREAQEHFKKGSALHESKDFKEAIEAFKKCASINPYDEKHLEELTKKLKTGSYKFMQESIAYMGCAAVHLNQLISELTPEEVDQVPLDKSLSEVFNTWNE